MNTDLKNLSKPQILNATYVEILSKLKDRYRQATGVNLTASSPEIFLLENMAYQYIVLQEKINEESLSNLLPFATGKRLDCLGAFKNCPRLKKRPAMTTLQFTLHQNNSPVLLKKGIRVSTKDGCIFATTEQKLVEPNTVNIDIPACAVETGESSNGYLAGEINQLLEPLSFVEHVQNTTLTVGGGDDESDERYAQRIYESNFTYSTAGPRENYIYQAKSAHQTICSVSCWSPSAGVVCICPLTRNILGGCLPSPEILALVEEKLTDSKSRPLTDCVKIVSPVRFEWKLTATVVIYAKYSALFESIKKECTKRCEQLTKNWSLELGRDIVPEAIVAELQAVHGVYRAVVASPEYKRLENNEFSFCSEICIEAEIIDED